MPHAFVLRVGKDLENAIDTASNVALNARPLHNNHLKILKALKLLMTLSIKMEKKHGFFKQKKIWNSTGTATCPRTSTVKTSLNITSEVLINVGLFESNEKGDIFPKRNSRIPAKAGKKYTVDEVLKTTLKKHSDSDQLF